MAENFTAAELRNMNEIFPNNTKTELLDISISYINEKLKLRQLNKGSEEVISLSDLHKYADSNYKTGKDFVPSNAVLSCWQDLCDDIINHYKDRDFEANYMPVSGHKIVLRVYWGE